MRTLLLCDKGTVADGRYGPLPTTRAADLGELLTILATRMDPDGVVILADSWADLMGTDAGGWQTTADPEEPWARWTCEGASLWTLEHDNCAPGTKYTPLVAEDPAMTAMLLAHWNKITGATWYGGPPVASHALLRELYADKPKPQVPDWYVGDRTPVDQWDGAEVAYDPSQWQGPAELGAHRHGYDLNKAYLSALLVAEFALKRPLRLGPHQTFDRARGGMWRVTVEPWTLSDVLPDPAGYGNVLPDGSRWLSTPRLALLQDIADGKLKHCYHGGFVVHESWTHDAARVTRKFAEVLRDAIRDHPQTDHPIRYAAQQSYKTGYGAFLRPGGRIVRPDWYYGTVGLAGANLWRKLHKAWTVDGRTAVEISTDSMRYDSDAEDWEAAAPPSFTLDRTGLVLGAVKPDARAGENL